MAALRRLVQPKHILAAGLGLSILLFWLFHDAPRGQIWYKSTPHAAESKRIACNQLPGIEDVVVVLKTGATEIADKLPAHQKTSLQCYGDYIIFSDYGETYLGETIHDVLASVNSTIQEQHTDFALWRRLREEGRSSLQTSEMSGTINRPHGGGGKENIPAWKLDKWKFLPMMNRTLHEYPDKKWYVFVEFDTHIFWQSLLKYFSKLDWHKPYYMGAQILIGDVEFAHGGAGFAASRTAMELVTKMLAEQQREWEEFTDGHWAGDCVLGKAFKDAGAPLMGAFPIWQGDPIGNMNYATNGMWCGPSVSYHHIPPDVAEDMWNFEQSWIAKDSSSHLRHLDVYAHYILPRTSEPRRNWDNHSADDQGHVASFAECQAICEDMSSCVQYALTQDKRCMTTARPNLGEIADGVHSGWINERMKHFFSRQEACQDEGWKTDLPS